MSIIRPFRAVIYNPQRIKNLTNVVCPPYDIISPVRQAHYRNLHAYNLIHILLSKEMPGENKYILAGRYFRQWLKEGILIQETEPAIYLYSQDYNLKGETKTRLGFIGLLKLDDKNSAIYGHEHTQVEPKTDRLRLLKQVRANLSPIFVIISDRKKIIPRTFEHCLRQEKPFIELIDDDKTTHRLWRITSGDILSKIQADMRTENIFIADGHHRYEVACTYRERMMKRLHKVTGEEPFNFMLTYFTSTDQRGLTVLPIHRLIKVKKSFEWGKFQAALREYFEIEDVRDKSQFFFMMEKAGGTEHVLGMYRDRQFFLLRLKNIKILEKEMPERPKEYRSLDVSILNYIILKKVIGLEIDDRNIIYNPDPEELISTVDNGESNIAFFLNPIKVQQIMDVALVGEKMPPKSTYFYPKVLSGMVINKF